jgi:putative DNA primase/helicase
MSQLLYALRYASRGLRVFPCRRGGKAPLIKNGYKDATCDAARIRAWWEAHPDANIGVACGLSHLAVIDLDGAEAVALWQEQWAPVVEAARGAFESFPPIALTPRPGQHLYFRVPKGVSIPSSRGQLGNGIDVKAEGGYVIAPPSLHPNGGHYRWAPVGAQVRDLPGPPGVPTLNAPAETNRTNGSVPRGFPFLPGALVDVLVRKPRRSRARNARKPALPRAYALAALLREGDAVRATLPGARNNRLFQAACSVARFVASGELAEEEYERVLVAAGRAAGLEEAEVRQTIANGLRYAEKHQEEGSGSHNRSAGGGDHAGDSESGRPEGSAAESPPVTAQGAAALPDPVRRAAGVSPLNPLSFAHTDTGYANLLRERYGDRLRFEHNRKRWLIYDGTAAWQTDVKGQVANMVVDCAHLIRDAALALPEETRRRYTSAATKLENTSRITATLERAATLPALAVQTAELDLHPDLLACSNGVVELRSGQLRKGDPAELITLTTGIPYDPGAECPRWHRFLQETFAGDAELIDYVQQVVGYSLTGLTREQILLLCYGKGANGKTTFFAALHGVLGDYGYQAPESTFEARSAFGGTANTNDLAALVGRRLVTVSETAQRGRLNEARVKQMTGGDPISARFLYGEFFTYMPQFQVWLATNYKPPLTGTDLAVWRRVKLIPFTQSFLGREERDLGQKLADESPGILAWAVRGAVDYYREGRLVHPQAVARATQEYRGECDLFPRFVAECVERQPGCNTAARMVYDRYLSWVAEEGGDVMAASDVGKRLAELGFQRKRKKTGVLYMDVTLVE